MGAKKQTIGYNYLMSLHMGIGRGPFNEIAEIRAGDVTMIDDPICIAESGQLVAINRPDLFGGETKEGGIRGPMYVYNGAADQELQGALFSSVGTLPAIASQLGGDVPSFRGVVTVWFDGLVASLNPYPKEWSFRVRRTTAGWFNNEPWYPAKATITLTGARGGTIRAMNAAHMLYEINTNPEWGRGMDPALIDENSYTRVANQLCDEGLGLCIPWFRQESIKEFIPVIINHIGGVQYLDRETGKMTLRLIRGDYDVDDLPLFTPDTGLLDIEDEDASGEDTAYNEIIVKGFDPSIKQEIAVRVQNLASIQALGEILSNTIEYKGIPTVELLSRIAERELKVQLPLRKMTVVLDRRGWKIAPGMPYRISWPSRGISNLILRAGDVADGTLLDGRIRVKSVEDIFGMPETSYITPTTPQWTPPSFTPVASPETRLIEPNWRDYYRRSEPADRDAVVEGNSFVGMLAKDPPSTQTQGYDLATKTGTEDYVNQINGGFTAWLTLAADIDPLDTTLEVEADNVGRFMDEFVEGMVVLIDDEQIEFTAFDEITLLATIKRGVADTIPAAHLAAATIWLVDDEIVSDGRVYGDGETVFGKALTRTSTGLLDISLATEESITVDQRVFRPYPPGDVKVDAVSIYLLGDTLYPAPVLTWAHRDRIVQADTVVGHTEGSVGPEPGTTYTVRVFDEDGVTLLRTASAISGTTWTYDSAMQAADGNPVSVFIELESVRDDLASYFMYRFLVKISAIEFLLLSSTDELEEPSRLLLSGDQTDGDDKLRLSGDYE